MGENEKRLDKILKELERSNKNIERLLKSERLYRLFWGMAGGGAMLLLKWLLTKAIQWI